MTAIRILLLLAAGAALAWWGLAPRIDRQADRADQAEQLAAERQGLIDLQAGVLAEQQRKIGAVTDLEQQLRALNQTVTRNTQAQSRALEELKRNDQETADYLATAVPAALGRLYQRPETTDPAAYRSPDPLSAHAVPPPSTAGAGDQ
jgi:LysB family phage lysis regulatory protein